MNLCEEYVLSDMSSAIIVHERIKYKCLVATEVGAQVRYVERNPHVRSSKQSPIVTKYDVTRQLVSKLSQLRYLHGRDNILLRDMSPTFDASNAWTRLFELI